MSLIAWFVLSVFFFAVLGLDPVTAVLWALCSIAYGALVLVYRGIRALLRFGL